MTKTKPFYLTHTNKIKKNILNRRAPVINHPKALILEIKQSSEIVLSLFLDNHDFIFNKRSVFTLVLKSTDLSNTKAWQP